MSEELWEEIDSLRKSLRKYGATLRYLVTQIADLQAQLAQLQKQNQEKK